MLSLLEELWCPKFLAVLKFDSLLLFPPGLLLFTGIDKSCNALSDRFTNLNMNYDNSTKRSDFLSHYTKTKKAIEAQN